MNISRYELKVSDSETNKELRLSYYGNENVAIYQNVRDVHDAPEYIHVPRAVLEAFVRLINEC